LQLSSSGIDLPKLLRIPGLIEQDTLIEVVREQRTHSRRGGARRLVGPDVFCADRVGLCLLVILALLVPAYCHRKGESDDEAEQCQRCALDDAKVFAHVSSSTSTTRSNVSESKPRRTSKAQSVRLFPSWSLLANSTATNRGLFALLDREIIVTKIMVIFLGWPMVRLASSSLWPS
jgi:hypothetical protein